MSFVSSIELAGTQTISDIAIKKSDWAFLSARKFIQKATTKQSKISDIYRETLKVVLGIFGNFNYINSENEVVGIKCMHSNPERTIAKLKQESNIILPVISVSQTTTQSNENRIKYSALLVQEKAFDTEKQRAVRVVSLAPRSVDIIYNINIWTKYKSNMDQIIEQIRSEFNPSRRVKTSFNEFTQAFLTEETDNSLLRTGDREDRILRKGITISVETYIPSPKFILTSTGKIETFNTEIHIISN